MAVSVFSISTDDPVSFQFYYGVYGSRVIVSVGDLIFFLCLLRFRRKFDRMLMVLFFQAVGTCFTRSRYISR